MKEKLQIFVQLVEVVLRVLDSRVDQPIRAEQSRVRNWTSVLRTPYSTYIQYGTVKMLRRLPSSVSSGRYTDTRYSTLVVSEARSTYTGTFVQHCTPYCT